MLDVVDEVVDDAYHTLAVGLHGGEFDMFIQSSVLATYACGKEEQINLAHTCDKPVESLNGGVLRNIHTLAKNSIASSLGFQLAEQMFASSRDADLPPLLKEGLGDSSADARSGSYDNGSFHKRGYLRTKIAKFYEK